MSSKDPYEFEFRRQVSFDKDNSAIYDKLKSNSKSFFYQSTFAKIFITAMALGLARAHKTPLKKKVPNVYTDVWTDEEKWIIISAFMKENPKLGVKALFEPNEILDLAEEYANAGIKYLDLLYEQSTEPLDELENELRDHLKCK